jgi:hypothetical protein
MIELEQRVGVNRKGRARLTYLPLLVV